MHYSPLLLLHITGGTIGLISGFITIALRKGSNRHRIAGYVFVGAMLSMAAVGAYLATRRFELGNVLGGMFTFYLVATAAMASASRPSHPSVRLVRTPLYPRCRCRRTHLRLESRCKPDRPIRRRIHRQLLPLRLHRPARLRR